MNKIVGFIITLMIITSSLSFGEDIKSCSACNNKFPLKYSYCPIDGKKLKTIDSDTKDIDGFQKYKWGMSLESVKELLLDNEYKLDDSNETFTLITISDFIFQGKESLLKLEFYKDKLYKSTVHFTVDDNTGGMNSYFTTANMMSEVYGKTKKIAIGRESDDYNHRTTQISIGNLTYQHKWKSVSGNLTFQLAKGSYSSFICSLYYQSVNADDIDKQKAKSEF